MKYILSLEISDFNLKGALIDTEGRVIYNSQKALELIYPHHNEIELNPCKVFEATQKLIEDILSDSEIDKKKLLCLGVCGARDTVVVWDKITKKPLWNAIVKNDSRTQSICDRLKGYESVIYEKTGVELSCYGPATKVRWILDHAPNVIYEHCLFGGLSTWILWNLTKGQLFASDMSLVSKSLLFNIHEKKWDDELISLFGLNRSMLPKIYSSNHIYGSVDSEYFGVKFPICSMVSDTTAALFAASCTKKGDCHLLAGSSAYLLLNNGNSPIKKSPFLTNTLGLYLKDKEPTYILEGMIPSTGSVIKWLETHLGILRSPIEIEGLAYSVNDSGGVYFVPAITGFTSPHPIEKIKGTLLGLSPDTNIGHICRATLEGLAFLINDLLELFQRSFLSQETKISCSGGMTENVFFLQILSNISGSTFVKVQDPHLSILGAAYLAGLTLGVWKDETELEGLFSFEREFRPEMEEKDKIAMIKSWKQAVASAMLFSLA